MLLWTLHMSIIAHTISITTEMLHGVLISGALSLKRMMHHVPKNIPTSPKGTRVGFYGQRILFGGKSMKGRDETQYSKMYPYLSMLLRIFRMIWALEIITAVFQTLHECIIHIVRGKELTRHCPKGKHEISRGKLNIWRKIHYYRKKNQVITTEKIH